MLVLTRKPGERIVIGDDIVVTLVSIRRDDQYGDKIRIGLEAPSHVPIRREEVPDPREGASPSSSESSLDSLEEESRQLRQKVEALHCQVGRARRAAPVEAQQADQLCDALLSLRRRCDELLGELGKMSARSGAV